MVPTVREITVGDSSPTQMRDITAPPVTFATIRYASGGGSLEVSDDPAFTFGEGTQIDPDQDFNDPATSNHRYLLSSSGNITVRITDWRN